MYKFFVYLVWFCIILKVVIANDDEDKDDEVTFGQEWNVSGEMKGEAERLLKKYSSHGRCCCKEYTLGILKNSFNRYFDCKWNAVVTKDFNIKSQKFIKMSYKNETIILFAHSCSHEIILPEANDQDTC